MRPDFKDKLQSFFEGCQRIHAEYHKANGYDDDSRWNMHWLKKWVRIECPRAFAFVDIETGEVLKPDSFNRPAITKVKRGNIFDEHNGLQNISWTGVGYAREIKASVSAD